MPRRFILRLLALLAGLPTLALAQSTAPQQPVRRIVVFRHPMASSSRFQIAEQAGGQVTQDLKLINAVGVTFPAGQFRAAVLGLQANPDVLRVDEDFVQNWIKNEPASLDAIAFPAIKEFLPEHGLVLRGMQSEADPAADAEQPWGIQRVNAQGAWNVTRGKGAKVAVIDTGIDATHPDLKANVKGGWNAITKNNNFADDHGHGTHCSGTIAANGGPKGVIGVAPEASLYGVKVLDSNGSGTFADVIAGIQWAADNKMDVASMSLGASQGNQDLADAVTAATKAGLTIVAAAGNSGGSVGYPGAYPECIAISASDNKDKIASFSSRGPEVALIAPGVDVKSTYMGGGYETMSGTSMATPHVSGLAALAVAAKGVHGQAAIRKALQGAAVPLKGLSAEEQGAGLVNAAKLVK